MHVGVSGVAQELNLESQAFNAGYCSADVSGCLPDGIFFLNGNFSTHQYVNPLTFCLNYTGNSCVPGSPNCLVSGIDMWKVNLGQSLDRLYILLFFVLFSNGYLINHSGV